MSHPTCSSYNNKLCHFFLTVALISAIRNLIDWIYLFQFCCNLVHTLMHLLPSVTTTVFQKIFAWKHWCSWFRSGCIVMLEEQARNWIVKKEICHICSLITLLFLLTLLKLIKIEEENSKSSIFQLFVIKFTKFHSIIKSQVHQHINQKT